MPNHKKNKIKMIKKIFYLFLICLSCNNIFGQEPIQTDRPDQTEGVFIVPKNYLQIESGFNLEKNKNTENTYFLPTTLLKFGLCKNFEFQTEINAFSSEERKYGILPISLGFKLNLLKEKGVLPEIALIGRFMFKDLATNQFKGNENLPMFRFSFQNTITDKFSIGYNLGMQWEENVSKPSYVFTLSNGYAISDSFSIFAEFFNSTNEKKNKQIVDVGFVKQLNDNFILDFAIGKHFNNEEQDFYALIGFTTRFNLNKRK
jgi:hypothetical protein